MDEPNAVWTVDFKGQFKMRNGRYCYPLTIQDGFSRFLLECRGLYSTSMELAKPVFIKTFREFGLPAVIRSDNGTPFRVHRPRSPHSAERLVDPARHPS